GGGGSARPTRGDGCAAGVPAGPRHAGSGPPRAHRAGGRGSVLAAPGGLAPSGVGDDSGALRSAGVPDVLGARSSGTSAPAAATNTTTVRRLRTGRTPASTVSPVTRSR